MGLYQIKMSAVTAWLGIADLEQARLTFVVGSFCWGR